MYGEGGVDDDLPIIAVAVCTSWARIQPQVQRGALVLNKFDGGSLTMARAVVFFFASRAVIEDCYISQLIGIFGTGLVNSKGGGRGRERRMF